MLNSAAISASGYRIPESTQDGSDEFRQQGMLAPAGLPMLADPLVGNPTELQSAAVEICLPVVVKPVSGSGAELYRIVDEIAEHTSNVTGGDARVAGSAATTVRRTRALPV
ncbi:hypothetical protein Q1M63_03940 (plasmid) [Sinorhizobium meliloti]|nr:hypothetical protein Q1M63_03940 [Sinorhizobium meliloti]